MMYIGKVTLRGSKEEEENRKRKEGGKREGGKEGGRCREKHEPH